MDQGNHVLQVPTLSAEQFAKIGALLQHHAGIALAHGKEPLVTARLYRRLRALHLEDFETYLRFLDADKSGDELRAMVDALTTNKTNFFREPDHFDFMREVLIPRLAIATHPVRIWSAGCSSGEEPYSIAITLREEIPNVDLRDIRILGTDISTRVLAHAREGVYDDEVLRDVPGPLLARYFQERRVTEPVRRLVSFARLNLMEPWPMRGPFDAVFCRNVMIYFDNETRERIVDRFWELLRPGGHLFVGGSESLSSIEHRFQYIRPSLFRRPPG